MGGRRYTVLIVAVIAITLGVAAVVWVRSGRNADSAAVQTPAAPKPPPIALPDGKAVMRIAQRNSQVVPGSDGMIQVHIADVTAGQVELSVFHKDGRALVGTTSMKEGDETDFVVGGFEYVVSISELNNYLLGGDDAVIEIRQGKKSGGNIDPKKMIELLLAEVESSGLTFIRNGKEHSPEKAAAHLRRKWRYAGSKIKTPEQFIDELASKSSTTGKPYLMRLKDGSTVKSADWLRERLEDMSDEL